MSSRSKSPKSSERKESPAPIEVDRDMPERARQAQAARSKKQTPLWDKYAYHIVFGVFAVVMIFVLADRLFSSGPDIYKTLVNDPDYIAKRKASGITFTVSAVPHFDNYTLADVKRLINNEPTNKQQLFRCQSSNTEAILPQTYNFRTQYPSCARNIIAQGNCSASYAYSSVSSINDRWCRNTKEVDGQRKYPILSPQAAIACDKAINNNCAGGFVSRALDYAKLYGLTTEECYPYSSNPQTPEQCQQSVSKCEKHKIADYCVVEGVEHLKQEIFNHGPVVSVITIYRDFLIYKGGVYTVGKDNQRYTSGHAVKVIGWDVKDGQECWLVENTWGTEWGEDGIGCIQVNQDEIGTERYVIAVALHQEVSEPALEEEAGIPENDLPHQTDSGSNDADVKSQESEL